MVLSDLEKGILARFFEDYLEVRTDSLAANTVLEKFYTIADVLKLSEDDRARLKYIAFHFARLIRQKECVGGKFIPYLRHMSIEYEENLDYISGYFFRVHASCFQEAYRFWKSNGGVMPQF
jgi:hypothetical protein